MVCGPLTTAPELRPVVPQYDMNWLRQHCFRDPFPISRDYFLCSDAPRDKFGLYAIDRWGNRALQHLDPNIGSMVPTLLRPTTPLPPPGAIPSPPKARCPAEPPPRPTSQLERRPYGTPCDCGLTAE